MCPYLPPQVHGAHLLAGFVTTRLEHSRDGMGIADWAEVLFIGGLRGREWRVGAGYLHLSWCLQIIKRACASVYPTHQGGSCCLGRCSGQVSQHLFHLGQLLSSDVIRIWISSR